MAHAFSKLWLAVSLSSLAVGCVASADAGEDEPAQGAQPLYRTHGGLGSPCTFETCNGTDNPFGKCTATDIYSGRCTQCSSGGTVAGCSTDPTNGTLECKQTGCPTPIPIGKYY